MVVSYSYNALGQRVQKTSPTGTTLFVYDPQGRLLGEYLPSGQRVQETVWLGDIPVATVGSSRISYIWADHLGTPRQITDPASKQILWRWDGEPFGNSLADEDPSKTGKTFSYNLRFPGQYFDKETGKHYNYFRDYDPATGRYIESDPIGLAGGINTYGYVEGNPIKYSDSMGLVKHTTGRTINCGKCTIRIDYTFDERTGQKSNHLHWDCKGKEGSCGENGEKSHGGSWEDAPDSVKECASRNGFQGDSILDSSPNKKVPSPPWWFPLLIPAGAAVLSQ